MLYYGLICHLSILQEEGLSLLHCCISGNWNYVWHLIDAQCVFVEWLKCTCARSLMYLIQLSQQPYEETGIYTGWLTYPIILSKWGRQVREPVLESRWSDLALKLLRLLYIAPVCMPRAPPVGAVGTGRHGTQHLPWKSTQQGTAWALCAMGRKDQSLFLSRKQAIV